MDQREKTLISSIALSSWGPLTTGFAMTLTSSLTQKADFLRRSIELISMVTAWMIYRYVKKNHIEHFKREKLEWVAMEMVSFTMIFTGSILLIIGLMQIKNQNHPEGDIRLGLFVALMGLAVNSFFWKRYHGFYAEEKNALIFAQKRLYKSKVLLDLAVIAGLLSVHFLHDKNLGFILDSLGMWVVSGFLLKNGLGTLLLNKKRRLQ